MCAALKQAEKSEQKRQLILSAAIDEILSKGIHHATTNNIATRANVSRGAILYYYPNRDILMYAALEKVLTEEVVYLQGLTQRTKNGDIGLDELIDQIWHHFSGSMFMISLEYLTAARTNNDIKNVLVPLAQDFNQSLENIWEEIVPDPLLRDHTLHSTLCIMRGMGLQNIWRGDDQFSENILGFWKAEIKNILNNSTMQLHNKVK